MTDKQYRAFLDLLMCSDPWPVNKGGEEGQEILMRLAESEAKHRGYNTWVDAYHLMVMELR